MPVTRRGLIHLAAGLAAARPWQAGAAIPRQADIVVIGAGAAGIAAARKITAAGHKVVVLEATGAIGGRCQTDTATFDMPFDRGARWLYNPDTNPLVKAARSAGLEIATASQGQKIRIGRRYARASEAEDFLATLVRANRAIDEAARRNDISCSAVLPKDLNDWLGATEFLLGPFASGKDLKEVSVGDQFHSEHRDSSASVRVGLGALVARLGDGLAISLNTPVTRIAWTNRDVSVESPAGVIAARAVIVTVSTNVLTSGKIKFSPDLPKRQLDAAAKLGLGSYDHIAIELPGNPLGLSRDDVLVEQSKDNRTGILYANMGGSTLCSLDVGGSFGRDLSLLGDAAMMAFAREWIARLFGNDAAAAVKRSAATRWNSAPYVLGAMSAAAPGGQAGRRVLIEPLGTLFLAGEATHETGFGTVGGAWESGERAADAALKKIGTVKDEARERPERSERRRRVRPERASEPPVAPSGAFWPRT